MKNPNNKQELQRHAYTPQQLSPHVEPRVQHTVEHEHEGAHAGYHGPHHRSATNMHSKSAKSDKMRPELPWSQDEHALNTQRSRARSVQDECLDIARVSTRVCKGGDAKRAENQESVSKHSKQVDELAKGCHPTDLHATTEHS